MRCAHERMTRNIDPVLNDGDWLKCVDCGAQRGGWHLGNVSIVAQAEAEFEHEQRRAAVEQEKARLRRDREKVSLRRRVVQRVINYLEQLQMSAIDIAAVEAEARAEINAEATGKAKNALKHQMRVVETARQVLRAEELKLQDIKAQIADGTH